MKLIMENWRKFIKEDGSWHSALNLAIDDLVDTIVAPADLIVLHNYAEDEAKRQYPFPENLDKMTSDDPGYRRGHDQSYFQQGFRHILASFMIEHKMSKTPTEFVGKRYEDFQYLEKFAKDIIKPKKEGPRHDPDDRKADEANNILGIALADKYENYRLKYPDYIKIVKQTYMNDGDFWTKATLGSGEILKYKDLVTARKSPDPDTQKDIKPASPFDP